MTKRIKRDEATRDRYKVLMGQKKIFQGCHREAVTAFNNARRRVKEDGEDYGLPVVLLMDDKEIRTHIPRVPKKTGRFQYYLVFGPLNEPSTTIAQLNILELGASREMNHGELTRALRQACTDWLAGGHFGRAIWEAQMGEFNVRDLVGLDVYTGAREEFMTYLAEHGVVTMKQILGLSAVAFVGWRVNLPYQTSEGDLLPSNPQS